MKSNHRCVLYARTACDGLEPSNNTSNQLDMVRQYAQGIGLKIVGEYFDSGASGRYETFPPDLMQVMNLASERKIDAIVLRDPSRL
jgi:DNA invertase Pin-like site-specific DNA recombinase